MQCLWFVSFSYLLLIERTEAVPCILSTGITGQCIPIHNCACAIHLLRSWIYPEVCYFDGGIAHVCCPGIVSNSGGRTLGMRTPEIRTPESSTPEIKTPEIRTPEMMTAKIRVPEIRTPELRASEMKTAEIKTPEIRTPEISTPEKRPPKIRTPEIGTPEIGTPEIGTPDIGTPEIGTPELRTSGIMTPGMRTPGMLSRDKCDEFYPPPGYKIAVYGGDPADAKEFPHMALIGFDGEDQEIEWLCGGSLISHQFVLTAAHCLNSSNLGAAKHVRLGDLDLSTDTDEADPQQFKIIRSIPHPDYQQPSKYNDIALIELDRPINQTNYVSMACLDTVEQHEETQMQTTGWGKVEFQGRASSVLLKANLDISSHAECRAAYNSTSEDLLPRGILENMMICAGNNKSDTCQGDSGGPLQVKNYAAIDEIIVYNIVGVTSFGKVCGISNAPGVYTRVFHYLDWIEKTVWPNE